MVIGIGADIVKVEDIAQSIVNNARFVSRTFTMQEIEYCEGKISKYQHYAARIAAKESMMKALGFGWDHGVQWKDIEIIKESEAPPQIKLHNITLKIATDMGVQHSLLTLSHNDDYAIAFVVLEK